VILSAANLPAAHVPPLTSYHDVTFVDEAATEKWTCPICLSVAFAPPNQTCSHVHCRTCLEKAGAGRCPQCREPLDQFSKVNGYVQREIVQLRVRCHWRLNGCEWQSELGTNNRNLLEHLKQCQERSVKCEACGEFCLARQAADHPRQCEARIVTCMHCMHHMKYKEHVAHLTPGAASAAASQAAPPVTPCTNSSLCPNGCTDALECINVLPTRELDDHMRFHCENRQVTCEACAEAIEARLLSGHQRLQCSMRIVPCQHCKEHMAWRLMKEHQQSADAKDGVRCRGFVLCENRCRKAEGGALVQLRPGDVGAHKLQCPLRLVACEQCDTLMLYSEVDAHHRQRCMQRVVSCHHCGDSLTWEKLQVEHLNKQRHHKKGAHAPVVHCASLQVCALGCKTVHRKDASATHLSECTLRTTECPCCTPPVQLKYHDVMAHVKLKLTDATQHDKMANLLIRLAEQNKQHAQNGQQKSARAGDAARKENQDKINRALADIAIEHLGMCRSFWILGQCRSGARCEFKHGKAEVAAATATPAPASTSASASAPAASALSASASASASRTYDLPYDGEDYDFVWARHYRPAQVAANNAYH
jgi:hypothetical protein